MSQCYEQKQHVRNAGDPLHDLWFDLDMLSYDQELRIVQLLLGESKLGPYDRVLTITDVVDCEIRDNAQIRFYDFNKFKFRPRKSSLEIRSSFPLRIILTLGDDFVVGVSMSDDPQCSDFDPDSSKTPEPTLGKKVFACLVMALAFGAGYQMINHSVLVELSPSPKLAIRFGLGVLFLGVYVWLYVKRIQHSTSG